MPKITIHTTETAPNASREALGAVQQNFGFTPNVLRQMAESPAALNGTLTLMGLLDDCSLSQEEKWITLLVTSSQTCTNYCVAANSTIAQMMGVPEDIVFNIRLGHPLADSKLEALRVFATEMVQNQGAASPETTKRFLDAGHTHAQLLDVILAIGLETIVGLTAQVVETPVDEPFQPYIWSQPAAA